MAGTTILKTFNEGLSTRLFRGSLEVAKAFVTGAVEAQPQDIANYPIIDTGELMRARELIPYNVYGKTTSGKTRSMRVLVNQGTMDTFMAKVTAGVTYNGVTYKRYFVDARRQVLK